jgi:hypothetical protein
MTRGAPGFRERPSPRSYLTAIDIPPIERYGAGATTTLSR